MTTEKLEDIIKCALSLHNDISKNKLKYWLYMANKELFNENKKMLPIKFVKIKNSKTYELEILNLEQALDNLEKKGYLFKGDFLVIENDVTYEEDPSYLAIAKTMFNLSNQEMTMRLLVLSDSNFMYINDHQDPFDISVLNKAVEKNLGNVNTSCLR